MPTCKVKTIGIAPYSSDGCTDKTVFAINTHLNGNKSSDPLADIAWHKALSNYVLNCGEGPGSFSAIMKLFNFAEVEVSATEYWQRHMSVVNFNITAANTVTGAVAGNVTLIVAGSSHINNGKGSFLNAGYSLVNQRNLQMYEVVGTPNKAVDFGHTGVIRTYDNQAVELRAGDPLGVFQARIIGDVACSTVPSIMLRDYGYMTRTNPMRFEASWCLNEGINIQNEVRKLEILDNDGNTHTEWDPLVRHNTRGEMERAKTMYWLFGTIINNPNITAQGNFTGFNGYLGTLKNGGGNYFPIPYSGITKVQIDMVEQQAVKFGIREFTWLLPWTQRNNLNSNMAPLYANASGSCTFETFERSGSMDDMNGTAVLKKGAKSLNFTGITHHFMTADWAQESNGLGVEGGVLSNAILVFPSAGAKDIKGNEVPTFENLKITGPGSEIYRYYETYDRQRQYSPNFCEKVMGVIRDTIWNKINCVNNHWWFQPSSGC